jgi:hypothetical protein
MPGAALVYPHFTFVAKYLRAHCFVAPCVSKQSGKERP